MKLIIVPNLSVNEDEVKIINWLHSYGSEIKKDEPICEIETTKSIHEIVSDTDGFLYFVMKKGEKIKMGNNIALISEKEINNTSEIEMYLTQIENEVFKKYEKTKITKKAELLIKKNNIDVNANFFAGKSIGEDLVNEYLAQRKNNRLAVKSSAGDIPLVEHDLVDSIHFIGRQERVLILGAGGGCNLVLDIISRTANQRAVCILDNNIDLWGRSMMGVPVIGGFELIDDLWLNKKFDGVISTIVRSVDERREIFNTIQARGIRFTNIIDETANLRLNVKIGTGNLIVSGCYLGPSVTIGNNNFLACYSAIEHHSIIGSHCTFGPRFTASGRVSIGDNCNFGAGISIEPFVKIGDNSSVSSGAIITNHIPENAIVKTEIKLHVKIKETN